MAFRVFIDGHVGTTGLRIHETLAARSDIEVLAPSEADRKNPAVRRALLLEADAAILCLPDEAAREAVAAVADSATKIIDASTAHRVDPAFVYGLPEMTATQRTKIVASRFVANPGCYPTSVILAIAPLVEEGLLPAAAPITLHALSGYTGGGKSLIEKWQDPASGLVGLPFEAPYSFDRQHKHVPEMIRFTGLLHAPQFLPAVGPFACGMRVEMPLHAGILAKGASAARIHELLEDRYAHEVFVRVAPLHDPFTTEETSLDPQRCNGTNSVELHIAPHPDGHVVLIGLLDNLGKGASGAAVQNLNLMLGLPETTGLRI
ncbi:MAG: N-acetyl-gamma-glutamyl-phosphate reductase [Deltaproteobacteria bacterium]